MVWIAYTYDHPKKSWKPSPEFTKVYRKPAHIKSALEIKRSHWEITSETPDLIYCELVHYYRNPSTKQTERHTSPGAALIFIEVTPTNGKLPKPPNITPVPIQIVRPDPITGELSWYVRNRTIRNQ